MKPRIFVSSTFYDLKFIREDIANFIKVHDFEPIMFEDGDIGYTPGKPLDHSCYETMRTTDMGILIVGGQYGSPATGEITTFNEYISVTRNEFKTAIESGIPMYVFIDKAVYSEYGIYESNILDIEKNNINIIFNVTKNINVFRFIREIKNVKNIVIVEFEKTSDIKDFLSKQWSDMFKMYLSNLKQEKQFLVLENMVTEIQKLNNRMNCMMDLIEEAGLNKCISKTLNDTDIDELTNTCKSFANEMLFKGTANDIKSRREFILNLLNVIENIPYFLDVKEIPGFETAKGKELTALLMKFFIDNNLKVRIVTKNLLSILLKIKCEISNTYKHEYVIQTLSQEDNFNKMFEN